MKSITDSLKLPILVVGAGARIIIFDKRYNIEGRATFDLDFAIKLDSWSDFEALTAQMTQGNNPLFKGTLTQHRFEHIGGV